MAQHAAPNGSARAARPSPAALAAARSIRRHFTDRLPPPSPASAPVRLTASKQVNRGGEPLGHAVGQVGSVPRDHPDGVQPA